MDRRTFVFAGPALAALGSSVPARKMLGDKAGASAGGAQSVKERSVPVSRFGTDDQALRCAIATGVPQVEIDIPVTLASDVTLRSDQTLRFTAGRIIIPAGATITEGGLYSRMGSNITLLDPIIDASAVQGGTTAILLADTVNARIQGGRLTRANLRLDGNKGIPSRTDVTGTVIDLAGSAGTALYLSGIHDVTISGVTCLNGLEGIGVYNKARRIVLRDCISHGHRQDGFLIMVGQQITHTGCKAYDNGQSGFTTQRQTGGNDSRLVTWTGCEAWDNAYDGFDIRGASTAPWQVETGFVLSRCSAHDNAECGFYIVKAEGTVLEDCTAALNSQQNLFVDTSDRVTVRGFRSLSGAASVTAGPNKAGILVYNSHDVRLIAPVSANDRGITQEFGISFTGGSRNARITGGDFARNRAGARLGGDGAELLP